MARQYIQFSFPTRPPPADGTFTDLSDPVFPAASYHSIMLCNMPSVSYSLSDDESILDDVDHLEFSADHLSFTESSDDDDSLSRRSDRPTASLLTSLENITIHHEQSLLTIQRSSARRVASLSARLEKRRANILSRVDRLHRRIDRSRSIVQTLMESNSHDDRVTSRLRRHLDTIDRTPTELHELSTTLEKLETHAERRVKRIDEDAKRAVERATAEKERLVNVHRRYLEISASRAQQQQQQQVAAAANAAKQAAEQAAMSAAVAQSASRFRPPVILPTRSQQQPQPHYVSFVAPPQPQQRTLGRPTPRPGTQAVQFRQIYVNHLHKNQHSELLHANSVDSFVFVRKLCSTAVLWFLVCSSQWKVGRGVVTQKLVLYLLSQLLLLLLLLFFFEFLCVVGFEIVRKHGLKYLHSATSMRFECNKNKAEAKNLLVTFVLQLKQLRFCIDSGCAVLGCRKEQTITRSLRRKTSFSPCKE
ncbi:hypothetical protein BJ742DRAFT_449617 [Cladochytrium replicatum]|nr:hypothetical protein BJ742DRAFT_449617 [Cladochytrium replicatum]